MIAGPFITPACTGNDGAGAATVTSNDVVSGIIYGIYIDYVGDDAATTDVTISTLGAGTGGDSSRVPAHNLFVATNIATSQLFLPRAVSHVATTGVASTTADQCLPVDDKIVVTVAQANTGDIIKVWFLLL